MYAWNPRKNYKEIWKILIKCIYKKSTLFLIYFKNYRDCGFTCNPRKFEIPALRFPRRVPVNPCKHLQCRAGPHLITVAVWTQKKFFPLLTRPQGSQGCQKITFYFLKMKLFSFCAKIALKRHKLQKPSKLKKKCFLRPFQIFFNLGAILAHQTSTGMFSGSWRIFWRPWDTWGRIHIENIKVLAFVFDISEWWRPLQLFSNNSK